MLTMKNNVSFVISFLKNCNLGGDEKDHSFLK